MTWAEDWPKSTAALSCDGGQLRITGTSLSTIDKWKWNRDIVMYRMHLVTVTRIHWHEVQIHKMLRVIYIFFFVCVCVNAQKCFILSSKINIMRILSSEELSIPKTLHFFSVIHACTTSLCMFF